MKANQLTSLSKILMISMLLSVISSKTFENDALQSKLHTNMNQAENEFT